MNKKAKLNLGLLVVVILVLFGGLYLFLPSILGDTVYPLKYTDEIKQAAKDNDISPAFLAGLIMAESGFNPGSTSGAGAQGLVQLMPGTAKTVAKELGMTGSYDLHNPQTSITLGAKHIRDLFDGYNTLSEYDQTRAVLVAYNAGSGTADAWVRGGMSDKALSRGVRSYVTRVMHLEDIYETMYYDKLDLANKVVFEQAQQTTDQSYRKQFWVDLISKSLTIKF